MYVMRVYFVTNYPINSRHQSLNLPEHVGAPAVHVEQKRMKKQLQVIAKAKGTRRHCTHPVQFISPDDLPAPTFTLLSHSCCVCRYRMTCSCFLDDEID